MLALYPFGPHALHGNLLSEPGPHQVVNDTPLSERAPDPLCSPKDIQGPASPLVTQRQLMGRPSALRLLRKDCPLDQRYLKMSGRTLRERNGPDVQDRKTQWNCGRLNQLCWPLTRHLTRVELLLAGLTSTQTPGRGGLKQPRQPSQRLE